ncbi:MAG: LapA family protein [Bacteroidota bacterium]
MRASLVVALILAILAAIFALQNPQPVAFSLGPFELEGSVALVLIVTFALGVVAGALASLPAIVKRQRALKQERTQRTKGEAGPPGDVSPTGSVSEQ